MFFGWGGRSQTSRVRPSQKTNDSIRVFDPGVGSVAAATDVTGWGGGLAGAAAWRGGCSKAPKDWSDHSHRKVGAR
jgi:hypothetical protein